MLKPQQQEKPQPALPQDEEKPQPALPQDEEKLQPALPQDEEPTTHLARSLSRKAPPPALVLINSKGAVSPQPRQQQEGAADSAPLMNPKPIVSSPTPSSFTDSSVALPSPSVGGAAAGTAPPPDAAGNPPVHRVQMDFAPSMGDELELRAGQLVRLLHEYDDGWALCIRLDRSQQGVCPRTCLSQRPVKPRPPPSQAPAARGPSPPRVAAGPLTPGPHGFPSPGGPVAPPGTPRSNSPVPRFPLGPHIPSSRPQSTVVRPQSPIVRPHSPQVRPQSPAAGGGGGYVKREYRPATPSGSRPQSPVMVRPQSPVVGPPQTPIVPASPTTPAITVSPEPEPPTGSPVQQQQQSPAVAPRPAVAPIRSSPLSNQASFGDDEEEKAQQLSSSPPVFHAM